MVAIIIISANAIAIDTISDICIMINIQINMDCGVLGRILLVRNIFTMESDLQHAVAAIGQSDQLCKSTRAGTVGDFLTGF